MLALLDMLGFSLHALAWFNQSGIPAHPLKSKKPSKPYGERAKVIARRTARKAHAPLIGRLMLPTAVWVEREEPPTEEQLAIWARGLEMAKAEANEESARMFELNLRRAEVE